MHRSITGALLAAAVLLGGCAAQVVKSGSAPGATSAPINVPAESSRRVVLSMSGPDAVLQSKDWESFKGEWRSAFQSEASAAGIALSFQDGQAKPLGEAGTLLAVHVSDYRYLTPGARFGFGVMTGNAFIDAKIRYLDLKSGQPFGEQSINTSSSAWQGVFSAMTDKQVQAIAKDVVADIKRRPPR
jgi:hypothetical protein